MQPLRFARTPRLFAAPTFLALALVTNAGRGQTADISAPFVVSAPGPEGIEVGVRTGYAVALGSLAANTNLSDTVSGVFPIWVDAGYRFPQVFLGAYAQYGWGIMPQSGAAGAAYIASGGGRAETPKCGSLGQTCSGSDLKYGLQVQYHFASDRRFDPWVGYGVGMETLSVDAHGNFGGRSDFPYVSSTIAFTAWSPAVLQVGADYKLPYMGVGPFVMLDVSRFLNASLSDSAVSLAETIHNASAHEWLTFGLRGYFDVAVRERHFLVVIGKR